MTASATSGRGLGTRGNALALAALALAMALTQFGALSCQYLNSDEASFILMGADVASGNLPYVEQFDLKPPVIFLLIGSVIAIFGKSLLAIRLLGDLCLLMTAFMTFQVARRMTGTAAALGGALIYVVLASPDLGQPTLSELPATALLMTAVWLICRERLGTRNAAIAGCLVSLAILTRTNLAPVAAGLGLLILGATRLAPGRVSPLSWLGFGLGGLVPPALLVLVYGLAGQLDTLRLAMIDVPLAYTGQIGPAELLASHVRQYYVSATIQPALFIPATLLTLAGALWGAVQIFRKDNAALAWPLSVIGAVALCVAASLLTGGAAYPHYWLQEMPLMGVLCALAIAGAGRLAGPLVAAVLLTAIPLGSALAARAPALADAIVFASSDGRCNAASAAAHIRASGIARPRVWALYDHLVLWYLGAPQLSRAGVHPDNLARHAIITTLAAHNYVGNDEIGRIMRQPPDFIVTDSEGRGTAWLRDDGRAIDAWLAREYYQDARFGDILVYRRMQPRAPR